MIRAVVLMLLGTTLLASAGCYRKVVKESFSDLRALADKSAGPGPLPRRGVTPTEGFTIVLEEFGGSHADRRARVQLARLQREARLPDLWIRETRDGLQLCRGIYPSEQSEQAQQDLRQSRMVQVDGVRPYEHVQLTPLSVQMRGKDHPYNLRAHVGAYSLQIGFYDEAFGKDYQAAAEKAVTQLRSEGHEAYFYHGPNRSLMTVGLFSDTDLTLISGMWHYGPRIKSLQQQFPYNLGNGRTLVEKIDGEKVRDQPSFLVKVE